MVFSGEQSGRTTIWVVLGAILALVVGLALFRYLGTLLFAIFLYYATRPLYRQLDRYSSHSNVTTSLTILIIVLPMLAVMVYAGVLALRELGQFLSSAAFEGYGSMFEPYLTLVQEGELQALWETLVTNPDQSLPPELRNALPGVIGGVGTIAELAISVLARFFLMTVFLFYLLRDGHKLRRWFYSSIDHDERIVSFVETVDHDFEVVFVGNLAIVIVAAIISTVTYTLLNFVAPGGAVVAVPLLLGLLIGIGTLVPVVGEKIVYFPYGAYLFALAATTETPLWHPLVFFALSLTIVDAIPDFFARAFLSARSGVHMGLVLLGYVLGTMVFGWYGLFLGPLVVVLVFRFAKDVFPGLASDFLES